MCVTLLGRPYEKKVTGDVSIRDSLKKKVSQRGLGSHRPHGTTAELKMLADTNLSNHTESYMGSLNFNPFLISI